MKTETQIAKFYIKNKFKENPLGLPKCHKATCQRFLDFLERVNFYVLLSEFNLESMEELIKEKITDLKQAIKLYNEAGI